MALKMIKSLITDQMEARWWARNNNEPIPKTSCPFCGRTTKVSQIGYHFNCYLDATVEDRNQLNQIEQSFYNIKQGRGL